MTTNDLAETTIAAALTTRWVGRPYHYIEAIGSTSDQIKAWLAGGTTPPTGTTLLTDYQTAGRGRLDRRWEAPPATSLLFSILFRPGWPAERGTQLTMLAGVAVAEAIEAVTGIAVGLKWPNDIVIQHGGQWRKAGGLLFDAGIEPAGTLTTAVLGIGLNVNLREDDLPAAAFPATSLLVVGGRPVDRAALFVACLTRLEAQYDAVAGGRSPWAAWNERLITLGQRVQVKNAGAAAGISGLAETTTEWGALIVRDDDGRRHTIAAGDVTLRAD